MTLLMVVSKTEVYLNKILIFYGSDQERSLYA